MYSKQQKAIEKQREREGVKNIETVIVLFVYKCKSYIKVVMGIFVCDYVT